MTSAEREPIMGVWWLSSKRDPSTWHLDQGHSPCSGVRGRSLPEAESYEVFVRITEGPKLLSVRRDRLNMSSGSSPKQVTLSFQPPGRGKCLLAHVCGSQFNLQPWLSNPKSRKYANHK